jgi:RimJ/RimL family protein N-acetyltransferase
MKFQIRRAVVDDASALAAVEIETWRTAYQHIMPRSFLERLSHTEKTDAWRENLLKHAVSAHKRILVAVVEEKIIGFTRVGPVEDNMGLVYLLYVLPQYWGHGVGTELMHAALGEMQVLNLTKASLWVLSDNKRARRFYEKHGWTFDGQTATQDYDGVELEALSYHRII